MLHILPPPPNICIVRSAFTFSAVARAYKALPPLWYLEDELVLSDRYPSGLEWRRTNGWHEQGEMAGKWSSPGNYYVLRLGGDQYHAHRIVHYLRTKQDPGNLDVVHDKTNQEKDNRKQLLLFERKPKKVPSRRYAPRSKSN